MEIRISSGFIVLMLLVVQHNADPTKFCSNSQCLHEASNVMRYADFSVDPCDNFYKFACGNMLKNSDAYNKLPILLELSDVNEQQLLKLYREDAREDDHKVVKAAKQLYKACVTAPNRVFGIRIDSLKQTLEKIGGWPLAEGDQWKEEKFDWVNASYELRELGYDYSGALNLDVVVDPENANKYIFKMTHNTATTADPEYIAQKAKLFGFNNEDDMKKQLKELSTLSMNLDVSNTVFKDEYERITVEQLNEREGDGKLDYLKYINTIVGTEASITKDDYILVPTSKYFDYIEELRTKTSERTGANYLIWKALEPAFIFFDTILTNNYPNNHLFSYSEKEELRAKFCFEQTRARFAPDPIEVLYAKRHLSELDRKGISEIAENVKLAYVDEINQAEWIAKKDKQMFIDQINEIKLVVGFTEDYDKILNDLGIDLDTTGTEDSFELLARVTRSRQTLVYNQIKKVPSENFYEKSFVKDAAFIELRQNTLYIPATSASYKLLYNSERSQYLNYAILARIIGMFASEQFFDQLDDSSAETRAGYNQTIKCLQYKGVDRVSMVISDHLAYVAYQKWASSNEEEPQLKQLDYTPKQLFWILGESLWCFPVTEQRLWEAFASDSSKRQEMAQFVNGIVSSNPDIARDFSCPAGTPMHPSEKCTVY